MKNPLNGSTKLVASIIFGSGMFYATLKLALTEQAQTKAMTIKNDTRLTILETSLKNYYENQTEIKADIKTLLRRGN